MESPRAIADEESPARTASTASLGWIAGPLSTGLGLAAHVVAGGQAPGILIVVALAALLGMAASMAGRRRLPGWAVLLIAGLAQQVLHLAFAGLSTASGFSLPNHHGGASSPDSSMPGVSTPEGSGATHSLHLMLHLHVAAALVVTAVVTQWTNVASLLQRKRLSGVERAPGDADA